jgi:hypothetical protein
VSLRGVEEVLELFGGCAASSGRRVSALASASASGRTLWSEIAAELLTCPGSGRSGRRRLGARGVHGIESEQREGGLKLTQELAIALAQLRQLVLLSPRSFRATATVGS